MLLWFLGDKRLIGTWRSDYDRTTAEIAARGDISEERRNKLSSLVGKLELSYTKWRWCSTLDERTGCGWYRVVAKDEESAVIVSYSRTQFVDGTRQSIRTIHHIHFDGDSYWLTLGSGNVREFFRHVKEAESPL
jgi:hypothetical protein